MFVAILKAARHAVIGMRTANSKKGIRDGIGLARRDTVKPRMEKRDTHGEND